MKRKLAIHFGRILQRMRVIKYKLLSPNGNVIGRPLIFQPLMIEGYGTITFGNDVRIGFRSSPYFHSGYSYIEARHKESIIEIGDNTNINNNIVIIAESAIIVGKNVLIGTNVEIYDSDFHNTSPNKRNIGPFPAGQIIINDNVWIGSNVKILKNVTIGQNSIIAHGAVVANNIPENVIVGGVPAKILKSLIND